MPRLIVWIAFGVISLPAVAKADVVDSGAAGFTVKIVSNVSAPAAKVYSVLVEQIGVWWDPAHTWSGKSANLSLDPTPGGCFCEKLPAGGGVRHLTVLYADPGKLLRLSGGLGPLQDMAVNGSMTWKLTEESGKTTIEFTYKVGGYQPGGIEAMAKPVDGVLTAQISRLKRFVETGKPE